MLLLVVILSLLGFPSLCHGSEEISVPIGTSPFARLGSTMNLAKLQYKPTQVITGKDTTVPAASYREGIVLVESTSDVSTLLGLSQPVPALVLKTDTNNDWSFTGPFIKSAARIPDDVIVLFSYAEKLTSKKVIPKEAEPVAGWERRNRGATHYVKEVVYGSQLGFYLEIKPRRKEQDTEKVKEVIEKYSKKNKDPMYILKKIAKALKREKLTGCTVIAQGAVLTSPGCGKLDAVINDFSGFQSMNETEDIAIKAVLRPLKDFNPKNDEYIMKYTPQSFSPVLDKIQAMYVEMKGLQGKLMQFDAKNAADEDKQEKLYSTVSSVGFEIAVALADLTFQKGPEQFASAVDKYGPHELGYYEEQYQQLINKDVTRKRGSIAVPDKMVGVFNKGKIKPMTAPKNGFYKISYKLKETGAGKRVVKIFQGEKLINEQQMTCSYMCNAVVTSGSFVGILEQGDVIKAEVVVEGKVAYKSDVSVVFLMEL